MNNIDALIQNEILKILTKERPTATFIKNIEDKEIYQKMLVKTYLDSPIESPHFFYIFLSLSFAVQIDVLDEMTLQLETDFPIGDWLKSLQDVMYKIFELDADPVTFKHYIDWIEDKLQGNENDSFEGLEFLSNYFETKREFRYLLGETLADPLNVQLYSTQKIRPSKPVYNINNVNRNANNLARKILAGETVNDDTLKYLAEKDRYLLALSTALYANFLIYEGFVVQQKSEKKHLFAFFMDLDMRNHALMRNLVMRFKIYLDKYSPTYLKEKKESILKILKELDPNLTKKGTRYIESILLNIPDKHFVPALPTADIFAEHSEYKVIIENYLNKDEWRETIKEKANEVEFYRQFIMSALTKLDLNAIFNDATYDSTFDQYENETCYEPVLKLSVLFSYFDKEVLKSAIEFMRLYFNANKILRGNYSREEQNKIRMMLVSFTYLLNRHLKSVFDKDDLQKIQISLQKIFMEK